MFRICLLLISVAFAGCGYRAPQMDTPVAVSGKVTLSGSPLAGVTLMLQPLQTGHPGVFPTGDDGSFSGNLVPGKYAYYVTKGESAPLPANIDTKLLEANMERTVTVQPGQTQLDISL
ncbi:MAG: carboxypeptidase regulatory-like domain-containing protein [Planctomycetes bacterium]|nr:carboxypeptidase regulatory-like domain-containing protein [Planctomycetota bacterium]